MADRNGSRISTLRRSQAGAQIGFTLIESLVALSVLAFALALGLGALAAVQHGLDLSVLQQTLDRRLDTCHEALRGGLIDAEQLIEFGGLYVDPVTLEGSSLPSVAGGPAQVRIEVTESDLPGLYEVEFQASGRRGRIERTRRVRTKIYLPGATP